MQYYFMFYNAQQCVLYEDQNTKLQLKAKKIV